MLDRSELLPSLSEVPPFLERDVWVLYRFRMMFDPEIGRMRLRFFFFPEHQKVPKEYPTRDAASHARMEYEQITPRNYDGQLVICHRYVREEVDDILLDPLLSQAFKLPVE